MNNTVAWFSCDVSGDLTIWPNIMRYVLAWDKNKIGVAFVSLLFEQYAR